MKRAKIEGEIGVRKWFERMVMRKTKKEISVGGMKKGNSVEH